MPVDSKHPEFIKRERDYKLIGDCVEGQRAIKREGTRYLPQPNPEDDSEVNQTRYKAYKKRAVFHNVTARTVTNMVGQCFAIDPVPTMPDEMLPWLEDIDGAGVTANQQSKKALAYIVAMSRAFLWVDYPKTNGVVSQLDAEENGIRPRIILCDPRKVINWRVIPHGAKSKLSLVVIAEEYIKADDGFEAVHETQYRVLRLLGDEYFVEVHRPGNGGFVLHERLRPLGGDGLPLKEIPGVFIGAEANSVEVDKPLMLDIANLNVAHYRNSADYEEAVFMLGQPTPYLGGLSDSWVRDHMKGGIFLGSRECIPLPQGGTAGLLQMAPNPEPKGAMEQKEAMMQALGAKLVEKAEVRKTATEAGINEASETSILASCCKNVSAAYAFAFRFAAMFANIQLSEGQAVEGDETTEGTATGAQDEILFELNTDFAIARMSPEEAQSVLSLYQANLITFEEARDKLKSGGWAYLDDEEAKDQLEEQAEEAFEKAQAELKNQTDEALRLQAAKPEPGAKPGKGQPPIA